MDNPIKQKILIVDDSEINRSILADMLGDEYDIIEAEDGEEAVKILQNHSTELSVVLLDMVMPKMDGFEVLAMMNKYHWIDDVPVIIISAENSSSYMERAYELGITDYINRPFDVYIVRRRVVNTILLYAKQKRLIGMVAEQMYDKEKSNSIMVTILSHIVEFRNNESGFHVLHINIITELLLKALAAKTDKYHISQKDISLISMASSLHDIGKICVPTEILNKPGKLTKEEFEIIKNHSEVGADMLDALPFHKDEPLVKYAYEICRWHHERYDGGGYPDGLKGEEIPISAQVVSVADVYDALTSERVYKPPYTPEEAIDMILRGECGQFNPLLIDCLLEIKDTLKEELKINSLSLRTKTDTKRVVEDMLSSEELNVSERTLQLLEHERSKYQFFASMSKEIQFEYVDMPSMMTLSEWGANKLGLNEKILNPHNDPDFVKIFGEENIKRLVTDLRNTTPDNPIVQFEGFLNIKGKMRYHKFICRATWSNDKPPKYLGSIGKVTDAHDTYTQVSNLRREASHDSLTGLLNHKNVKLVINDMLCENEDVQYALLLMDLDNFADSNNIYGHMFGDEVLKYVAKCIRKTIRSSDVAARIGGDEFLIFIEYREGAEAFISRIFEKVAGKYKDYTISFSMGIALTEKIGRDYERLFYCADTALYSVKQNGRSGYSFYDESMVGSLANITPIDNNED